MLKRILLLGALLLLSQGSNATAQEISIAVEPSIIEVVAQPGVTINQTFVISNTGDTQTLTTSVLPFKPSGIKGDIEKETSLSGPIRFEIKNKDIDLNEPFILTDKKGKEIVLEGRIPQNIENGDYYYSFETTHEVGRIIEGTTSVTHKLHVNALLLITVSNDGAIEHEGTIGNFSIDSSDRFLKTNEPVPFRLILNNTGANLVKAQGYIGIRGPGVNKKFPLIQENVLSDSSKQLSIATGSQIEGFFIGKYVVEAYIDIGGKILRAQTSFIAIPWTLLSLFIATLIVISAAVFVIRKNRS